MEQDTAILVPPNYSGKLSAMAYEYEFRFLELYGRLHWTVEDYVHASSNARNISIKLLYCVALNVVTRRKNWGPPR